MRLNHIYITKEGEPMANPEMEYPTLYFISGGHEVARTDLDEALAKYHSGLLPFEKESVELLKDETFYHKLFKPDTLIPVDLEVEVVEKRDLQWRCYNDGLFRTNRCSVGNVDACSCSAAGKIVIIKVLRIKP